MREQIVGGHKLKIYDSIDELPMKRFHIYNKYMMIDSGVGSDITDADGRIFNAIRFIKNKDSEKALIEMENLRQALFLISEGISPKHLAFTALVYQIDGIKITDISDDGLRRIYDKINNEKVGWFNRLIESLKKKIDKELNSYFQNTFADSQTKEYYDLLKKKIKLMLVGIREDIDNSKEVMEVSDQMLMMFKPRKFGSSSQSPEISHDKDYEDMCILLNSRLGIDAKESTVLEFYNAFDYLKKTNKPNSGLKKPKK